MQMPGRNASTGDYRYGFQGQEKDDEVSGNGNSYTAEFWQYDSRVARRWNVDPIVKEHESPYATFANNPIWFIDPTGSDTIARFDADGQYLGWVDDGSEEWIGRIEKTENWYEDEYFNFADPINDPKALESGEITELIFVSDMDVVGLIDDAGGFDPDNHGSVSGLLYVKEEGKGMGEFDFSLTKIKEKWEWHPGVKHNPLSDPSSVLFYVAGTAHNHMNFGNFLYGAGTQALGLDMGLILFGAHYNSVFGSKNGYASQLDSYDDQLSITLGYLYGRYHDFGSKYKRK